MPENKHAVLNFGAPYLWDIISQKIDTIPEYDTMSVKS